MGVAEGVLRELGWDLELSGGVKAEVRRGLAFRTAFPNLCPQCLHLSHEDSTLGGCW